MTKPKVLLVEDESGIADTVQYALNTDGFECIWASTAAQALREFAALAPAVVILDVGLPDLNGFELFKRLQALPQGPQTPMLFLTARSDEIDRVVGLEMGADDYVAKPFSPRELVARVRTILRRHASSGLSKPSAGTTAPSIWQMDAERMQIRFYGQALDLTRYEFGVLKLLISRPGRVFSRDDLLEQVWDDPGESMDRTVDAHIKTVRAKLRAVADVEAIKTLRGSGYALAEDLPLSKP
jgi:two-component system, OmpR family, catabolic regulation response regulator CreB